MWSQQLIPKNQSHEQIVCNQLLQIKWMFAGLLFFSGITVISIFIAAMVFQTKVTHLSSAQTNQFLSDVYTMTANARAASQDAPVLMHSAASIAKVASGTVTTMAASNSTASKFSFDDIMDTVTSFLNKENLQMVSDALQSVPWEEQIFPLASQLLTNTENIEKVLLLVISALQHQNQPQYVVAELKES
jgi:hypothetical protein